MPSEERTGQRAHVEASLGDILVTLALQLSSELCSGKIYLTSGLNLPIPAVIGVLAAGLYSVRCLKIMFNSTGSQAPG